MEILLDPTIWVGLLTLIVLEIVLGIDNLIFIAILSDKLPPDQRQKARVTGLTLALGMRIILLFSISWLTTLTAPLIEVMGRGFSGRDLIMLVGGSFLLFKATFELHEKLEGHQSRKVGPIRYASFGSVILQIVVLDAVFSLDAVITAVGMSNHLPVMIAAVCISMVLMILASNRLMNFVSAHPTVVVLCLGFLLMIGFSLIVEGFGYHIPKGYLYAAIGFSVLIEAANQLAQRNKRKSYEKIDARTRVSQAVLGLLGVKADPAISAEVAAVSTRADELDAFKPQERLMVQRVLQLSHQPVRAIMTARHDLFWIDLANDKDELERDIRECPYSTLVVARDGAIDEPLGILLKKDLVSHLLSNAALGNLATLIRQPVMVPEVTTVLQTLDTMQKSRIHVAFVIDEFGSLEGMVTITDVLEAIAGDMPEAHESTASAFLYERRADGSVLLNGTLTLPELHEILGPIELPEGDYSTVAGIALAILRRLPHAGDSFVVDGWKVAVEEMDGLRVSRLAFFRLPESHEAV
jgi:CBS domain containing-hemolysin-like protein